MWVSRFDVVPIPEELRKNLSPHAQFEVPVETAISMYNFRAEDVVADIAPRPLLLFHTAGDVITPMEQSISLFEKAGANAELMIPTGVSHFPLSDEDAPHTRALIYAWLKKFFPTPLSDNRMTLFRPEDLKAYAAALLQAAGYTPDHAERTADILVWANARGAEFPWGAAHPALHRNGRQGLIDPIADPQVVTQDGRHGRDRGRARAGPIGDGQRNGYGDRDR